VQSRLREYADNYTAQLFSSSKKQGMEEAEGVIGGWLGIDPESKKKAPGQRGIKPGASTP
jgi:GTP-binding protein